MPTVSQSERQRVRGWLIAKNLKLNPTYRYSNLKNKDEFFWKAVVVDVLEAN